MLVKVPYNDRGKLRLKTIYNAVTMSLNLMTHWQFVKKVQDSEKLYFTISNQAVLLPKPNEQLPS